MSPTILRMLTLYNNLNYVHGPTGQDRFTIRVHPSVSLMDRGVFKQNDKPINIPMQPKYNTSY